MLKISKTARDLKVAKMQDLSIRIPVKGFTGLVTKIHYRPARLQSSLSLWRLIIVYIKDISYLKENIVRVHYKYKS